MSTPDPESTTWAIHELDRGAAEEPVPPLGPGLPPTLSGQTLDDGTVVAWAWERTFSGYSNRLRVWVNGANPVMLDAPAGYASSYAEIAASEQLLAVELPLVEKRDQIGLFDHRSGRLLTTFTGPPSVGQLAFSNGHLALVNSDGVLQVRAENGDLLWSATIPTYTQAAPQVARSGEFALVAGYLLFRDGRIARVWGGLHVVGDDLVGTRTDGRTIKAGVDTWIKMGQNLGWPVKAAGTSTPRVPPAPRWPESGTQTVRVSARSAPVPVAVFVQEPTLPWLGEEYVASQISHSRRFQEVRMAVPGGEDWTLDAAQSYILAWQGSHDIVGAFPGRTERVLDRDRPYAPNIVVRDTSGRPVAGARIYGPEALLLSVTDADGSALVDADNVVLAIHDGYASRPGPPGDLVLSEVAPRCRVLGFAGETWAPEADCESIRLSGTPATEAEEFELREVEGVWEARAIPQLLLRTSQGLTTAVDQSAVVDTSGACHSAREHGVSGVPPGPATWWARVGDQWWRSELTMGATDTVVVPATKRSPAPKGPWVATCGLPTE